ncbi:short chain dehydrogenase/reductase family [Cordyceps fumosorosea ARSEF 2679]|uniref:Short chain dehydrogenase/reductase family n=1 Tax=Cordyceps fumosorosea (strain ARSEF 2679) TaxID=1081104 RepID=A0A168EQD7_CORFA|nr:short chain dehydrogenase/reductase family [Cordyceps fumosorosea ARSEF 2679]OAA74097.1 short chain dehydrogenase/reductase family [Cordyceps fumosorosea ARSEF 2679]
MASTEDLKASKLFDLKDRGGSGIGLMAAQALAANGAKVYICGRTREKLENAAQTHGSEAPGQIIPIPADISSKVGISALVDEIQRREDCVCLLVNNAGISSTSGPVSEARSAEDMRASLFDAGDSKPDEWESVYRTNVASVFFTTAAFLPLLQRSTEKHKGWSAGVINITSVSGLIKTAQHHFAYNASKAAAEHLTRMLAAEVAAAGLKVRVNSVAPGVFPSEMTAKEESDDRQKSALPGGKMEGKVPAQRPGRDEDMAQAVLFAAANQYLNGQRVVVDGGFTLSAGM